MAIMKLTKQTRLMTLGVLWLLAFGALRQHRAVRGMDTVSVVLENTVRDLNGRGRLPLVGYAGGMANNAWQTATGHADTLGCGGQAEVLYAKLQGTPGWRFELRYEYGLKSPILLPHQWVTGYGPHGEVVQLDPWAGYVGE